MDKLCKENIEKIRKMMSEYKIDAYLIPKNNEFFTANVPENDDRLKFISGFDGSSGSLLITNKDVLFFTDSRYEIQAKKQLGFPAILNSSIPKWLVLNRNDVKKIGYDAWLHTVSDIKGYFPFDMIDVGNLVDIIWMRDNKINQQLYDYDISFSGESSEHKMKRLKDLLPKKIDAFAITDVDQISWLLNKRSNVFKHLPSVAGFMLFYPKKLTYDLFFNKEDFIKKIQKINNIAIDEKLTPNKVVKSLNNYLPLTDNPLFELMSIKNKTEQASIIKIHEEEGIAICNFLEAMSKIDDIDELEAVDLLEKFRKKGKNYKGKSFDTILAADENGAIVHYHPTEKYHKKIEKSFLLDCGSQYLGGTTDMTRTILFKGEPDKNLIHDYTLVLKGHIALALSIFPEYTSGAMLDSIAKQFLWKEGKDYGHGTGHGVGNFLNVHEGKIRISRFGNLPLKEGIVISCEPGFYKENHYGIRIENLLLTLKYNENFLYFKSLTLVPYDTRLIDKNMLNCNEIEWINNYHQVIFDKFKDKVENVEYLRKITQKI